MLIKYVISQLNTKGYILSLTGHHFAYILSFKNISKNDLRPMLVTRNGS